MLFSPVQDADESPTSTISADSNPTPPDSIEIELDEQNDLSQEHVTVNLRASPEGELYIVELLIHTEQEVPYTKSVTTAVQSLPVSGQVEGDPQSVEPSEPDISDAIQEAEENLRELKSDNLDLHRRVVAAHGRRRCIVDADMLEGQDLFYQQNLLKWLEMKRELQELRQQYHQEIDEMHADLEKGQQEAVEVQKGLLKNLYKIAREAQHSVSGQILSEQVLSTLDARNTSYTLELEKVRIVQRQLSSYLKKLDQARKKKDQLPGGLHLVDYEQLKMENESLGEKIHARNEEIIIMRKKRTATVHALSHVREKLQFVDKDTTAANDRLDEVEKGLHQGRIDLHNLKSRCEHISQKKSRMQKSMVNISDPLLLDDLENLKDDAEATEELLAELKQRYVKLNKEMQSASRALNARNTAPKKAADSGDGNTDSTVAAKHNLRWGEERGLVGRQKV